MFVICKNDYPIAVAESEERALKFQEHEQKKYDKEYEEGNWKIFVHIKEVPKID